jgi:uncharacterized RDD family membrane protein YckC
MSLSNSLPHEQPNQLQFARFSRRLRAFVIDWAISLIVIFGALIVAASIGSDETSRTLGIAVVATLILYEPLLVSRAGGTVGHYLTNLRVVDEVHGGNLSFFKAALRFVIKALIGWYSFIAMALTRRNQALHDLATRSTVMIRDAAKAAPSHFITERAEFDQTNMPSRLRRLVAICIYPLLAVSCCVGVLIVFIFLGGISLQCADRAFCKSEEKFLMNAMELAFLAMCAFVIIQGWRGKLVGARKLEKSSGI